MADTRPQSPPTQRPRSALALGLALFVCAGPLLGTLGLAAAPLTGQYEAMGSYDELRVGVAREGPDDVVLIGSSVFRYGAVPGAVAAALEEALGAARPPRVFSFGAPGHNLLTYPTLVELVLGVERPRVLVFLVTPRTIDATAESTNQWASFVAESPYAEALHDPWRLRGRIYRGWLDHSPLARYGPTLRARLTGEISTLRRRLAPRAERGYLPVRTVEIDRAARERQREVVAEWRSAPSFADALDRAVAAARASGARVLLVDAPLSDGLRRLMRDPARNLGGTRRFLEQAGQRLGVPVAQVPKNLLDAAEYADLVHYLPGGAERYSRWLGAEIARNFPELRFD